MKSFFDILEPWDRKAYNLLHKRPISSLTRKILKFYTRLGDGFIWLPLICYLFLQYSWSDWQWTLLKAGTSIAVSLFFYYFIKLSTKRPRPFQKWEDMRAEVPPLDKWSFPSGHTMNNLAVAIAITSDFPELLPYTCILPASWGLLRVYFGVHYASDVIVGLILGTLSALLVVGFWP